MSPGSNGEGALRALLVEDNPGDVLLIREAFATERGLGFQLDHVERLREALSRLDRQPANVVLLDLGLPDSQGVETVRRLHEKVPKVPIVVLTTAEDPELVDQVRAEGAQDYLVKGLYPRGLLPRTLRYAISRHEMEQRLREERALDELQLAALSDLGQGAAIVEDGSIALANEAYARLCEVPLARLRGLPPTAVPLPQAIRQAVQARVAPSTVSTSGESTMLKGDGRRIEVEYSLKRLPDTATPRWFLLVRDIGARKHATEALRQSEERWRDVIETLPDGYFESDTKGTLVIVNEGLARLVGRPRSALVGATFQQFVAGEDLQRSLRAFGTLLQRGEAIASLDIRILHPQRGLVRANVSASRIVGTDQRPSGFRGLVREVYTGAPASFP